MPIRFSCPNCNKQFKAKDSFAGKKVKCSGCAQVIQVPAASAGQGAQAKGTPPAPPPKKRPKPESEEYELVFEGEQPKVAGAPQAPPGEGAKVCPGCKRKLSANAKICVDCGINLITGRKIHTELVTETPGAAPQPAAILPGEEAPGEEEKREAPVGEEIPFYRLLLNMFVKPISTMQMLFVYVSSKPMLYKMLGFYVGTLVLLGLIGILQAQLGGGDEGAAQNIAGLTVSEDMKLTAIAVMAIAVMAHLFRTIIWALILSITGYIFGAGGKGNFLATFVALAFVYGIGNCVEAVLVGTVGTGALFISPVFLLPLAPIFFAVPLYRGFLFVLAVKVVYDMSWWMAILFIVIAYILIYWLVMMWLSTLLVFLLASIFG